MRKHLLMLLACLGIFQMAKSQDTVVVQTLTYDSTARAGVWEFPSDTLRWRKIIMQYSMRCHDALVGNGNVGCREWDYSCNTVITDSSRTDSSKKTAPSHVISNFSGSSYDLTNAQTWTYYDYAQQQLVINSTTSEQAFSFLGTSPAAQGQPFGTSSRISRAQYLWTAAELSGQSLTAGNITGMRFNLSSLGSSVDFLRIKIKASNQSTLDANAPDLTGFTEVYFLNTQFGATGWQQLNFHTPFNWNGLSNLLVEISYRNGANGTDNQVQGYNTAANLGMVTNTPDQYFEFTGAENIDLASGGYGSISNEITLSFWSYGGANLPVNTSVFEGTNASNARQVNVHLPWSNGDIYWDCGADAGGYDRINKTSNANDYKNRWTHWAFTKNATTGEMKIWMDGQLWHSGTGKTKPINLQNFKLGSAWNGGNGYQGKLNEFAIFNVALDSATIRDWMFRSLSPSHPNWSSVVGYYKLDEGSGAGIVDASGNGLSGTVNGVGRWGLIDGQNMYTNFATTTNRPQVEFIRGVYNSSINTVVVRDSVANAQDRVISYGVVANDLVSLDTNFYFQAGWQYVYDGTTGQLLDSIAVPLDSTINVSTLTYYRRWPSRFEIMSFVTPYGNGLDLGADGVMWEFDLTDFSPILTGRKRLSVELAGANQEEMDIRFIFIEGIPPRDVVDIQPIWPANTADMVWSQFGMNDIYNDVVFEPRSIPLDPTATSWKIRSSITGHGQNGEFVPRWHWLDIGGGAQDFRWRVWKECADIPVYPQGGTWLYDRAGWCPGQPTDLYEWEIGNLATPGQLLNVDYGMDVISNTSQSGYLINHQLVSYTPNNFNLDAAVTDIKRPSKNIRYGRFNPACNSPVVIIRNEGTTTLTSLTIEYNQKGGPTRTFQWTGSLDFLESEEVSLPVDNALFWTGTDPVFEVHLTAPNGGSDEQPDNDIYAVEYGDWDTYVGVSIDFYWRTNNQATQNTWRLLDENGTVLMQNSPFLVGNTTYIESFNLPMGCYSFEFNDAADDGLYYWASPGNGTGFARMRANGAVRRVFEPEFGRFFKYDFWTDGTVGNEEVTAAERIAVYPNPSSGRYKLEMEGFSANSIELSVFDLAGRKIWSKEIDGLQSAMILEEIDLNNFPDGTYLLRIFDGKALKTRELVKISH